MKIDKEQQIQEHISAPYKVGEQVYVRGLGIQDKDKFGRTTLIKEVFDDGVGIEEYKSIKKILFDDVAKFTDNLGVNPFEDKLVVPRTVNFGIESILSITNKEHTYTNNKGFELKPINWNPTVIIDGELIEYQRNFCWDLEDKQLFIESIYNHMDCGKIVVRRYDYSELEDIEDPNKCYFADIVDGKQRLSTLIEFVNNEFPDYNGYYFKDLSTIAQRRFGSSQVVGYAEFNGKVSDKDILKQFLLVNHTGKPQSKEHIDFVKSLYEKIS